MDKIGKPLPCAASIAMANPVIGDHVQMTNHIWSSSIAEMKRRLGLDRLVIINDFEAIALSLTALGPADCGRSLRAKRSVVDHAG